MQEWRHFGEDMDSEAEMTFAAALFFSLGGKLGDLENQFSADVAGVDHVMGKGSVLQRKHIDRRHGPLARDGRNPAVWMAVRELAPEERQERLEPRIHGSGRPATPSKKGTLANGWSSSKPSNQCSNSMTWPS
jgi:hypothetical protein